MSLLLALQGDGSVTGTLAATEAQDVAAFTAQVVVEGALATTEAQDIAAFTAEVIVSGALATSEAQDTAAFTGNVIVSGTLAATEAQDIAEFDAEVSGGEATAGQSGAGSGGHSATWANKSPAFIAPFIRWGKKKKTKQAQITEVADVIKQTVAKADAPYIAPVERDLIAARLLETENLAQLRRIRTIDDMLARIERELMEMDDEEAILLLM